MDERDFFSYERFKINQDIIEEIDENEKTKILLNDFTNVFLEGINFLSEGNLTQAGKEFYKSRKIWPEYFAPDFMLALVYDESGDINKAARFYKSYLEKLHDFHVGKYRISAPLIRFISNNKIERYSEAQQMVNEHLSAYGIDLDKVRPATMIPPFIVYVLSFVLFIGIYVFYIRWARPRVKRKIKIKNPPEGFWICKNCGAEVPGLSNVCTECRYPRGQ